MWADELTAPNPMTCPLCSGEFACMLDFGQHMLNKPGHLELIIKDILSMRAEIVGLKEAIIVWRELARSRVCSEAHGPSPLTADTAEAEVTRDDLDGNLALEPPQAAGADCDQFVHK